MEQDSSHSPEQQLSQLLGISASEVLQMQEGQQFELVNDWRRGGAETYNTDFILSLDGLQRHLIAKACIKLCPVETVQDWLGRRSLLEASGICVPEIAGIDGALWIEEYINFSFSEAYQRASMTDRDNLSKNFFDTYKTIERLGFDTRGLHDIRSRGSDVVMIDYGEDLGPPRAERAQREGSMASARLMLNQIIR